MGFWDFHLTADRHWQWRHVCENTGHCTYGGRFRSRNDCIADAMRHGYLTEVEEPTLPVSDADSASRRKSLHGEAAIWPFLHGLSNF